MKITLSSLLLYNIIYYIYIPCYLCLVSQDIINELHSHSFIGVYGYPGSGNNWIHEILRFTPGVSTIHEGCALKHGALVEKMCTNTQYSAIAQTSNGKRGVVNLKPDILCVLDPTPTTIQSAASVISEIYTKKLWDTQQTYFVEASTKLALRVPFLKLVNEGLFGDQKYLISIKHPICVESGFPGDWLEAARSNQIDSAVQDMQILLEVDGNKVSGDFHDDPHCEGYNSKKGTSWISFMKILTDFLSADEEWSLKHVRIVRYEDFQSRPIELCRRMFKFLFLENSPKSFRTLVKNHSSPYYWKEDDINNVCVDLFPELKPTLSPTKISRRKLRSKKISQNNHRSTLASNIYNNNQYQHRELKKPIRTNLFRGNQYHLRTSLGYDPTRVNATCGFDMSRFRAAYDLFDEETKSVFENFNSQISKYGYSFDTYNYYTSTDVLAKWNLMKE